MTTIDSLYKILENLNKEIKKNDALLDKYYTSGEMEKFDRVEKLRDRQVIERRKIRLMISNQKKLTA